MIFRTPGMIPGVVTADTFPHLAQPDTRPGEFETEYGESDGNDDQPRSGRYEHDYSEQKNCGANGKYRNAACGLVREMRNSMDHEVSGCRSICTRLPPIDYL